MSDVAIRVDGLGKQYQLGTQQARYHTLSDQIRKWTSVRKLLGRAKRVEGRPSFWAIKDVSFEVQRGDVVGIIGRNGAGKSTLLKILSRITEPTEGWADIHGRVGSLLEVGTGFHPELTGRENVYLNGAILGMRRTEIVRKFDEIVAFAEVEKFIDTPVKHYSSGMYMRLAFGVAAHLDSEILVVDEVLAVGDSQFQKKCLGKMGEVATGGRTVLFVSHNMAAIGALCRQGVVLGGGEVAFVGPVASAIEAYNAATEKEAGNRYDANDSLPIPHFSRIEVTQGGNSETQFQSDREIRIHFAVETQGVRRLVVGVRVRNSLGVTIFHSTDEFMPPDDGSSSSTRVCVLPASALVHGTHFIRAGLFVRGGETYQALEDVVSFRVEFAGPMADRTSATHWHGVTGPGLVRWEV